MTLLELEAQWAREDRVQRREEEEESKDSAALVGVIFIGIVAFPLLLLFAAAVAVSLVVQFLWSAHTDDRALKEGNNP